MSELIWILDGIVSSLILSQKGSRIYFQNQILDEISVSNSVFDFSFFFLSNDVISLTYIMMPFPHFSHSMSVARRMRTSTHYWRAFPANHTLHLYLGPPATISDRKNVLFYFLLLPPTLISILLPLLFLFSCISLPLAFIPPCP